MKTCNMFNDIVLKTVEEYKNAQKKVEEFTSKLDGVVATGFFGEVSEPSISDIDFFVCFEKNHFAHNRKILLKYIKNNNALKYFFIHDPLIVHSDDLEYLNYLHTVNNLQFRCYKKKITFAKPSSEYTNLLNIIWTLFLIPPAFKITQEFKQTNLRKILHVLKNLHQSIDNLNYQNNKITNVKNRSKKLRKKILKKQVDANDIADEFKKSFYETVDLLNSIKQSHNKHVDIKKIIITKNLAVKLNNTNKIINKRLIYCSKDVFGILNDMLCLKSNEINMKKYIKISLKAYKNATKLKVPYIFVTPFGINFFKKSILNFLKNKIRILLYVTKDLIS